MQITSSRKLRPSLPWTPDEPYGGWGGHAYHTTQSRTTRPPIVFVHGNGRTADDWTRHANAALQQGCRGDDLWAVTFPHDTTPHDQMAAVLDDFIQNVRHETGAESVDIVAHSLGVTGVRHWFNEYDGTRWTRTFVAAAGANHGLPLHVRAVPFVDNRTRRVLSFLSPSGGVEDLNDEASYRATETYTVRGCYDALFFGRRYSPVLEKAEENVVLPVGHDGARNSRMAVNRILGWVDV